MPAVAKIMQLADALVATLNARAWPAGQEFTAAWQPLPVLDLADLSTLHVSVLAGHSEAAITAEPGQTVIRAEVAIVLQKKLSQATMADDLRNLLDLEQRILAVFLGQRLATYPGDEAICTAAEQAAYDLAALKERLEFLGILTLTFDLRDEPSA